MKKHDVFRLHLPQEKRPTAIRFALEKLSIAQRDQPLTKIYVEPTTRCNLQCATCMRNTWEEKPGDMADHTFTNLLKGAANISSVSTMAFWGLGEPLLHPHIQEMVRAAHIQGYQTEMITNGLLLTPELSKGLMDAGLDLLVVSLDGAAQDIHGAIRGGADLPTSINNVGKLQEIKKANKTATPAVGIEFVMTKSNLSQLPAMIPLANKLGAAFVIVTNLLPYSESMKNDILYWLCADGFTKARRFNLGTDLLFPPMDNRITNIEPLKRLIPNITQNIEPGLGNSGGFCPFVSRGSIAVGRDGGASPCVSLMHTHTCHVLGRAKRIKRYIVGNVNEMSVSKIWNDAGFARLRQRVRDFDFSPCTSCGGCDLSETNEEDCIGSPFPTCGDCLWAKGILLCP